MRRRRFTRLTAKDADDSTFGDILAVCSEVLVYATFLLRWPEQEPPSARLIRGSSTAGGADCGLSGKRLDMIGRRELDISLLLQMTTQLRHLIVRVARHRPMTNNIDVRWLSYNSSLDSMENPP